MTHFKGICMCGGCVHCLAAQGYHAREGNIEVESCDEADAADEVCRHARAIANYLDAAIGEGDVYPFQRSIPACWIEFDQHPAGRLLVLAMDAGQPNDTRVGALNELRERFLKEIEATTLEVAQRIANERYDEQFESLCG
jgi:hypothetical protein